MKLGCFSGTDSPNEDDLGLESRTHRSHRTLKGHMFRWWNGNIGGQLTPNRTYIKLKHGNKYLCHSMSFFYVFSLQGDAERFCDALCRFSCQK